MEILVFFGLIASGKSTLAEAFSRRAGVLYLNTDRVRKELAGIAATERRPDEHGRGIYSREYTEKTYQAMLDAASGELHQGKSVVLDGSYSRRRDRDRVLECGNTKRAKVCFILCRCSEEETRRRLEVRARDPLAVSDGRWDIYLKQRETFEHPDELTGTQLLILDTEAELEHLLDAVTKWLGKESLKPEL